MRDPETSDPMNPEPAPDATSRLSAGAPPDPYSTQQLNISKHLAASHVNFPSTASKTGSDQTQKLALTKPGEHPIRVQKIDQPAEAAGQTQNRPLYPEVPRPIAWKLPLALGAVVVLGVVAYLVFPKGPALQQPPSSLAASPQSVSSTSGAQIYLEQAKAGDAHAMRMLGVMHYYGLNVPQDREKGLYWYRKAAERGSDAARSELSKIEGGR
jgi:TPR repeat protein